MAICLFSALFLFFRSIKGLKIKQHKPFIYVFFFEDWPRAWQQTSQPACLCRANFHEQLEHLQTTAHYREDEEIRREAEWQKPHLKKNWVLSEFSWVVRVLPGCCTCLSFNKPEPVQPLGHGSTRRAGFNNYGRNMILTLIFFFFRLTWYSSQLARTLTLINYTSFEVNNHVSL
jgi:hypothetical protein